MAAASGVGGGSDRRGGGPELIGVALGADWVPASDWALIEASVRDVGTAHTPLVGFFSRYGWFHPGPWPLYVLAVPYRLRGLAASAAHRRGPGEHGCGRRLLPGVVADRGIGCCWSRPARSSP
ncbi:MAG: hypothetical protein R2699_00170 [Acidimicrobiales bacterium]